MTIDKNRWDLEYIFEILARYVCRDIYYLVFFWNSICIEMKDGNGMNLNNSNEITFELHSPK